MKPKKDNIRDLLFQLKEAVEKSLREGKQATAYQKRKSTMQDKQLYVKSSPDQKHTAVRLDPEHQDSSIFQGASADDGVKCSEGIFRERRLNGWKKPSPYIFLKKIFTSWDIPS